MMHHESVPPFVYALSGQIDNMKFHPKTGSIANRKTILQNIGSLYGIDASVLEHIQILKSPVGFQYGIHGCLIEDLLLPFWNERTLDTLRKRLFPQLTTDMLFSAVYGIHHIIASTRLDIRYDENRQDAQHWYFQKTHNGRTLNRQYFYEGLQDYALTHHRAELFFHYLAATSSSPAGGIAAIAFFDVAKVDGRHTAIIPGTQFLYNDILNAIADTPEYQKLVLKKGIFKTPPYLPAIRAGLQLLQMLWQCFTIEGEGRRAISPLDEKKGIIVRNRTLHGMRWEEKSPTRIFDSCHLSHIDFSDQCIQDDFIFCTFENCRFSGATLPPEGVQGRFPLLRCTFLNCEAIPKDIVFQNGVKNCRVLYE